MAKVVIMQPTFIPYYGYFKLMKEADIFIFLDNVQFSKQSWQHRNKISIRGKDHWLTIPIQKKFLKINETEIIPNGLKKISATLYQNFHFILDQRSHNLADNHITNIKNIALKLGITTETIRASEIGKTDIVDLCQACKATDYISTGGSRVYFDDSLENRFLNNNISIIFKDYAPGYSIVQYLDDKKYLKTKGL